MSSNVCQGLQSCLEPRLVEPRVLIQNLAQSIPWTQKPNLSQPQQEQEDMLIIHNAEAENKKNIIIHEKYYHNFVETEHESNKDGDSVWSCIQALTTTTCQNRKQVTEADQVYVHPLVKSSASTLSKKSLEMCTESLGSETGSNIDESIDDFPYPVLQRSKSREQYSKKKRDRSVSFPPPLTSISGSDGVQVRPHREGGRLVLKAVTVSSCSPYFQTERANGRLRLSLLKDLYTDFDGYEVNAYNKQREEEEENENADEEEVELEDILEELEMNGEKVGYEIGGVGELARPSRCKEGRETTRNKVIPSWGPCCVAIS
ncbi:hypothetical protein ACH5RR_020158 [Cinchona calisaya]|uniref:FAF domain-containing protein n=1 Tax=Cinchona calisaya TaxID=153742 RepID=A0ABD2ZEW2_9GENT